MKNLNIHPAYAVGVLLVILGFKSPDNTENIATPENRLITVTGSADMLVPPDEISVDITYREYWYNSSQKKKATLSEIEAMIVDAAEDAGVSKENITLNTQFAWKYRWNYWHYWYDYYNHLAQKNMTVKVTSSSQLNEIIQNLREKSIHRSAILNIEMNGTSSKKIQEYRKLVKERAVQAAQEKADYLLEAVGQKRGVVISVTELDDPTTQTTTTHHGGYYGWPWYNSYGYTSVNSSPNANVSNASVSMPSAGSGSSTSEDDLNIKPIRLRYEIQAVFSIRN